MYVMANVVSLLYIQLLHTITSYITSTEEFTGLVQDRIASEFSRLQYLMSLSNQHPLINNLQPVSNGCHIV